MAKGKCQWDEERTVFSIISQLDIHEGNINLPVSLHDTQKLIPDRLAI